MQVIQASSTTAAALEESSQCARRVQRSADRTRPRRPGSSRQLPSKSVRRRRPHTTRTGGSIGGAGHMATNANGSGRVGPGASKKFVEL